ncbi:hypothetical protein BKA69DRAFT_1124508 [Paraphysoderma sedebokerense]|nr:hypothetical protein BKA69DRAFT_1124508 [Paraphysoderma sedebokerense]
MTASLMCEPSRQRYFPVPLAKLRQSKIIEILRDHCASIDSVLDLGCGEGYLLSQIPDFPLLASRAIGIDCSHESLAICRSRAMINETDKYQLRERPCRVELYQGDINTINPSIGNVDAVVLCEVIEHLDPPVLAKLPQTLFEFYKPKLLIITTPNKEFNRNFPNMSANGLRIDDHRFEWTREEFRMWCSAQAQVYSYDVRYTGVGTTQQKDPNDTYIDESCGFCTQIAVFTSSDIHIPVQKYPLPEFPNYNGNRKRKRKLDDEKAKSCRSWNEGCANDDEDETRDGDNLKLISRFDFPWAEKESSDEENLQTVKEEFYWAIERNISMINSADNKQENDIDAEIIVCDGAVTNPCSGSLTSVSVVSGRNLVETQTMLPFTELWYQRAIQRAFRTPLRLKDFLMSHANVFSLSPFSIPSSSSNSESHVTAYKPFITDQLWDGYDVEVGYDIWRNEIAETTAPFFHGLPLSSTGSVTSLKNKERYSYGWMNHIYVTANNFAALQTEVKLREAENQKLRKSHRKFIYDDEFEYDVDEYYNPDEDYSDYNDDDDIDDNNNDDFDGWNESNIAYDEAGSHFNTSQPRSNDPDFESKFGWGVNQNDEMLGEPSCWGSTNGWGVDENSGNNREWD